MQRNYRFEIISVSREENSLPCSTEWDKSAYFTPSNLLPKSVVKMKHLTREQRYGISLMLQEGKSRKYIAKAIGVSTSTISRELRKNCDMRNGTYNYDLAQRKYETRLKLRGRKPVFTKEMKDTVVSLLEEGYSPEQIKGRSNVEGFAMVSHETMYRWIWEDKRKKGTLYKYLRRNGKEIQQTWKLSCGKGIHPQSCGYRRTPCNSEPKGKIWRFGNRYSYRKQP